MGVAVHYSAKVVGTVTEVQKSDVLGSDVFLHFKSLKIGFKNYKNDKTVLQYVTITFRKLC